MRSFLLYLVGSVLFTNKMNRHIDLIYLDCMADLQVRMGIGQAGLQGLTGPTA